MTITAEQIRADLARTGRREQADKPKRRTITPKRVRLGAPHPFEPDREQPVGTQCWRCWGWRDDPRHWAET